MEINLEVKINTDNEKDADLLVELAETLRELAESLSHE